MTVFESCAVRGENKAGAQAADRASDAARARMDADFMMGLPGKNRLETNWSMQRSSTQGAPLPTLFEASSRAFVDGS